MESTNSFRSFALAAAPLAAAVANYCDHVEHNEAVAAADVLEAGEELRRLAFELAADANLDLIHLYAERLGAIAARSKSIATCAETWRGSRSFTPHFGG